MLDIQIETAEKRLDLRLKGLLFLGNLEIKHHRIELCEFLRIKQFVFFLLAESLAPTLGLAAYRLVSTHDLIDSDAEDIADRT